MALELARKRRLDEEPVRSIVSELIQPQPEECGGHDQDTKNVVCKPSALKRQRRVSPIQHSGQEAELNAENSCLISCAELARWLTSSSDCQKCAKIPRVLLLDVRPVPVQARTRIASALGVPCDTRVKMRRALPALDAYLQTNEVGLMSRSRRRCSCKHTAVIYTETSPDDSQSVMTEPIRGIVNHVVQVHGIETKILQGRRREFNLISID